MFKDPEQEQGLGPLRQAKLEAAWPHLRAAVRKRALRGEPVEDLAGVVTESPIGPDGERHLTVGVLTRAELAGAIAETPSMEGARWLDRLGSPAPDGCIYVFGAVGGLPELFTLGPVFSAEGTN